MYYYSQSTKGFYNFLFHGPNIPADAVEITDEQHAELLKAQSHGATIQADDNGFPVAIFPQSPTLGQIKADLCVKIDLEADAARLKIAGDPLRVVEYQRAEAEAKAFATAGYTGTVPPTVESWAEAKGWTATEAADDILRAATAWNAVLYAFRGIRLKGKEAIKAGVDSVTAQAAADAAIAQIAAVLAQVA